MELKSLMTTESHEWVFHETHVAYSLACSAALFFKNSVKYRGVSVREKTHEHTTVFHIYVLKETK